MSTSLTAFSETLPVPGWRWTTARREHLVPAEMETRHLFNTLRMIWNNFMPPHMRVGAVRLYTFDPDIWPRSYLGQAIEQIGRELFRRSDLTPEQRAQLDEMARWLQPVDPALPVPVPKLVARGGHEKARPRCS